MTSTSRGETGRRPSRSSVFVRELETRDMQAASALLAGIWHRASGSPLDSATLVALAHSGNYVAGAFDDDRLVGVCVGFFGTPLGDVLHSHIAGVAPGDAGRGVGSVLKAHQRRWSQERGLSAITWTFDPLIARNAYFNFHRLGVRATSYAVDFYGPLDDEQNAGHDSDRLLVTWPVTNDDVAAGTASPSAVVTVLAKDEHERPGRAVLPDSRAQWCTVDLPRDIELLRRTDPDLARAWRLRLREVLPELLTAGWDVADVDRAGRYLLRRDDMRIRDVG